MSLIPTQGDVFGYIISKYIIDLPDILNLRLVSKGMIVMLSKHVKTLNFETIHFNALIILLGRFPGINAISGSLISLKSHHFYEGDDRQTNMIDDLRACKILERLVSVEVKLLCYSSIFQGIFLESLSKDKIEHLNLTLRYIDLDIEEDLDDVREDLNNITEDLDDIEEDLNIEEDLDDAREDLVVGRGNPITRYKHDISFIDKHNETRVCLEMTRSKFPPALDEKTYGKFFIKYLSMDNIPSCYNDGSFGKHIRRLTREFLLTITTIFGVKTSDISVKGLPHKIHDSKACGYCPQRNQCLAMGAFSHFLEDDEAKVTKSLVLIGRHIFCDCEKNHKDECFVKRTNVVYL